MKRIGLGLRTEQPLFLASIVGLLSAMPASAMAQPVSGLYVSAGAGVDFLQDQTRSFAPQLGLLNHSLYLDPGFAGEVSLGWGLGNGLRAEIEGDYAYNHVRKVSSQVPSRAGGYEQQYGGFANVLYDVPLRWPVQPYLGVGVGGEILEADNINSSTPGFRFPNDHRGGATVAAFAYQAIAGFSIPLPVAGLSFTTEYRFIGLLDPLPAMRERAYSASGAELAAGNGKIGNVFNHEILLGVRYAFGVASPPPPPQLAPVAASAPASAPARTYLVFFDWDRADLTDRARQIIQQAAQASTRVQYTRIEVNGYTDLSGTPQYNQGLSVRRAQSVAAELVRDGVPRRAITIQGFGETHPLVLTAQGVREPQNRRVEIVLR